MRYLEAKIINRYANKVLERKTTKLNKNDWNIIGKDLIPNDKTRAFYSKKIVMSNIELANQRIMAVLERNNITLDTPFEILDKARKIAESKENSSDLIKIAKELIEIQDLKPKQQQQPVQTEQISFSKILESGEKAKITAKREVKSLENSEFYALNKNEDPQNSTKTNDNNE